VHDFANLGCGERGFHGILQSSEARSLYHSPEAERNHDLAGYWTMNPTPFKYPTMKEMGLNP
ncbi:MAG TPA: hypothetical protein VHE33_01025, partial [Acidobacteriaceae bacterium]|nr:hypothetical protein [Acidobacteriaceae bacterium]